MIDFLVEQGVKMRRSPYWPDYHDRRDGGSEPGRTVIADLFDTNELGEWRDKLRPNFMAMPMYHHDGFEISTMKSSLKSKLTMLKVGLQVTRDKLLGRKMAPAGAALQGRMLKAALHAGADIRVNNAVRSFIREGDRIVGVIVDDNGVEKRIMARNGVLVNAGGFSHNQRMRDKYMPNTSAQWTAVPPGDTGEMIESLMEMGAASGQMNECVGNPMSIPPGMESKGQGVDLGRISGQMSYSKPHSFIVDQSGVRYLNESQSYMTFGQQILTRHETVPAIPSWWVFDQQNYDNYMIGGTMPGAPKPKEWYENGFLKKAATIEELATAIKVDPATLRATADRFNGFARKGVDEDFDRGGSAYSRWLGDKYSKPSATLGTVEKGPFYAMPIYPADVGTYGGVVTDEYARVLKEDGTPFEGLYATGTTTASVMGRIYPGAGASVGPSFVFGYIAARHAAGTGNAPA
ncbi:MAG TPA: FAD-binding protein [Sphingobium sp.]